MPWRTAVPEAGVLVADCAYLGGQAAATGRQSATAGARNSSTHPSITGKNPATPAPSSRSGTYSTSPARAAQPIGISSSATDHPRPTPGPAPPEFHLAIQPAHQRQQLPAGGLRGRPAADRALGLRRNLQRQHRGELREPDSRRRLLSIYTTTGTSCARQLGGPDIPGTTNTIGETSAPEVGTLHDSSQQPHPVRVSVSRAATAS
jgi:hypothetical protein